MTDLRLPTPAAELIPQSGLMRLIEELTDWTPDGARSRLVVDPGSPFVDARGALDGLGLVEILAQLAAASQGYEAKRAKEPIRAGSLVGVKDFRLDGEVRAGDALRLEVRRSLHLEGVLVLQGEARVGDEQVAGGTLKVWEQDGGFEPLSQAHREVPARSKSLGNVRRDAWPDAWRDARSKASLMRRGILDSLCLLEANESSGGAGSFRFAEDFLGFSGHFPGSPILPAVVMLEIGRTLGELILKRPLAVTKISHAKFSQMIRPAEIVEARVDIAPREAQSKKEVEIAVRLSRNESVAAKCHLIAAGR